MKRAVLLGLVLMAACSSGPSGAVKSAYCAEMQAAQTSPYSQTTFDNLQRDFPYQPGEDGYTAANDAVNAYAPDLSSNGPSVEFIEKASVYLTGWC